MKPCKSAVYFGLESMLFNYKFLTFIRFLLYYRLSDIWLIKKLWHKPVWNWVPIKMKILKDFLRKDIKHFHCFKKKEK